MSQNDRLRWQCRRGMLEIDLLLNDFLTDGFDRLSAKEAQAFESLLKTSDTMLLEWLMGRGIPTDGEIASIVRKIRAVDSA